MMIYADLDPDGPDHQQGWKLSTANNLVYDILGVCFWQMSNFDSQYLSLFWGNQDVKYGNGTAFVKPLPTFPSQ